ncbi:MAG: hypothetical protein CR982_08200 [Candidatus Cloacimonadota bacterium]|nr:MAG: hypothetical protein CR982_08200 [Candidatus Cloacimonadota bacterium]PIE77659.1 MAG: hypothetical protein CSA15_12100 [Candidatus Delongbacteria bacterium]
MDNFINDLIKCKETIKSDYSIVVGNVSADADSIISALFYSYYSYCLGKIVFPFINIPKSELVLREDIIFLLKEKSVNLDIFIFKDDPKYFLNNSRSIVLVDHNCPEGIISNVEERITKIYDHHKDSNWGKGIKKVITNDVSAASIIYRMLLKIGRVNNLINYLMKTLLILDSYNFSKNIGRFNNFDLDIYSSINIYLSESFKKDLIKKRFSIANYSNYELIIKDTKKYKSDKHNIVVSTITASFDKIDSSFEDFTKEVIPFIKDEDSNLYLGMLIDFIGKTPQRELIIVSKKSDYQSIVSAIESSFELKLLDSVDIEKYRASIFLQSNITISRKKMMPIVIESLDTK